MKKVLSLVMALVMMLAVSGCSEAADDGVVTIGVIQFMQHASLDEAYQGFVDGLAEAGYVEGENLKIDFQNASGEVGNCQQICDIFANSGIDLALAIATVVAQNAMGAGIAAAFGLNPLLGIATGSVPMVGGHGTSAAFGPILEAAGLEGGTAVAVASATFGLVAGCLIGGPIASSVIKKYDLKPTANASGNEVEEEVAGTIDGGRFLNAIMFLLVALGIGTIIGKYLTLWTGISVPGYIGAMMAAAIIRNVWEIRNWDVPMEEINTIGGYSLSVFLGLAMMGLKLWQLADLALPMIVMLLAQTVLMFLVARFVCFNILGKDYDAAVISSGLCGFGMGATPNAMANMQAVTKKNGPSPTAFLVVPLVGSLFIDFFNSIIITLMISFLG